MNYDIQLALNGKLDEWRFIALEQTVDRQKYDIKDLERKIAYLESKNFNFYNVINTLIDYIQEQNIGSDFSYLKQQL